MELIRLGNDRVEAEVVVKEGARIQHLVDRVSGRELLLQRRGKPGPRTDFLAVCTGGWDELFPTDSEWGRHPDHGRIWTTQFSVVEAHPESVSLRATLEDPPVTVERHLALLEGDRRGVRAETVLRATGSTGPFLWAAHPMLAVKEGWRIELPEDFFNVEVDRELPGRLPPGEPSPDALAEAMVIPAPSEEVCEVLYVDGVHVASVGSPDGAVKTRASWDKAFLRHLWLVTITGRFGLDNCLLIEPCTTRPYRLEDALAADRASTLAAGEERRWWFELESLDRTGP